MGDEEEVMYLKKTISWREVSCYRDVYHCK
jgi:hypothetical protein